MAKERDELDWESFVADLEVERAKRDARQQLFEVLSAYVDSADQFIPGEVARDVNLDLQKTGWSTQRFVSVTWGAKENPKESFIDVVATDPDTGFIAGLQFEFDIPFSRQAGHPELIHLSPSPNNNFLSNSGRVPTTSHLVSLTQVLSFG